METYLVMETFNANLIFLVMETFLVMEFFSLKASKFESFVVHLISTLRTNSKLKNHRKPIIFQ